MGLLYLVKQHDGVGAAAHLFGELSGLVIADIAGRRTDDARNAVLLHKLGHIQPDQRLDIVKQLLGKHLDQLGLADAGGADKDKGSGTLAGADAHPGAPHGGRHQGNSLILADNPFLQRVFQIGHPAHLSFLNLAGRNPGPQLDYPREMLLGNRLAQRRGSQRLDTFLQPGGIRLQLGQRLIGDLAVFLQLGDALVLGRLAALQLLVLRQLPIFQGGAGAGLIQQVDGLVRQETVIDIALRKHHRPGGNFVADLYPVITLIVFFDAVDHLHRLVDGRFLHLNRLEAALQCGVLFDVFAVFVEGSGADYLDFPAGEGRFENIGGIHAALAVAHTHQSVHFVDKQNHVARLFNVGNQPLDPAFKLAAELGSRHQAGQVEHIQLLAAQPGRYVSVGNALGNSFRDSGLAHAGLADQAGVVFGSPVENLHHAVDFPFPADNGIHPACPGLCGQIFTKMIQIFKFARTALLGCRAGTPAALAACKILEKRQRHRPAGVEKLVFPIVLSGFLAVAKFFLSLTGYSQVVKIVLCAKAVQPFDGFHHLVADRVDILVGDSHFLHNIVNRLDAEFMCAAQAQPLIDGLAVFQAGHIDHRHPLAAP